MYDWRNLTAEQRAEVLELRQALQRSWHQPTPFERGKWYHVTAACYEHRALIGRTPSRMTEFSCHLLKVFRLPFAVWRAWCMLPNHYHVLAKLHVPARVRKELGQLHGRSSHGWNVEEAATGRKCFHRALFKEIKSEAHWWSTINYIHHNPVRHGYVQNWADWPFGSAPDFLRTTPEMAARHIWDAYPITGMGKNWDEA